MRSAFLLLLTACALAAAPPDLPLGDFRLPPKSLFSKAMPRYPNAWVYLDASLAPNYESAVKLITGELRKSLRLREYYPPFDNPEGCDFEGRHEHLQPWQDPAQPKLQHAHSFHMRYYYSDLARQKLDRVQLGGRSFYRLAISVHYEVEHGNPLHADVESCPLCGRTGPYAGLKGNLVELVHDPLGLELLLHGTIRGQTVRFEDWEQREVGSVDGLRPAFTVEKHEFPALQGDRNTYRIGIVVLTPRPR
jgi:hypothetical protein